MTTTQAAKHTRGPWEHEDGEIIAKGAVIAQVMGADDFPCCEEDIDAECKANARLIAQAPAVAEALKAIVNWCNHPGHGGQYDLPKPLIPYLTNAERLLRDAGVVP